MGLSNLQLEGYYIDEMSFKTNEEYEENAKKDLKNFNVTFLDGVNQENHLLRRIKLTVEQKKTKNEPYEYKIVLVGFFKINESYAAKNKDKKIEEFVRVNGPSLLYSAAREMLAMLTGRGSEGSILLPTVTFADFTTDK